MQGQVAGARQTTAQYVEGAISACPRNYGHTSAATRQNAVPNGKAFFSNSCSTDAGGGGQEKHVPISRRESNHVCMHGGEDVSAFASVKHAQPHWSDPLQTVG